MASERRNTSNRRISKALAAGEWRRAAYMLDEHTRRYSPDYRGNTVDFLAAELEEAEGAGDRNPAPSWEGGGWTRTPCY